MNDENNNILNRDSILENLTRTLLYEGYSLFPYHRNAIKNQKPIPFGVVYPNDYCSYNEHAHAEMITDCIVSGDKNLRINVNVRFLHLIKTEILRKRITHAEEDGFIPVYELNLNEKSHQSGWQTIERKISSGDIPVAYLADKRILLPFSFAENFESENIYDESGKIAGKKIARLSAIEGSVVIKAIPLESIENVYRMVVFINNYTPVMNAANVSRDEIFRQSFLSTNTVLNALNGEFISLQNPGDKWKSLIAECENKDTWPILIEESNTTLLSSPIIVYDYPKINPKSKGRSF